MRMIAIITGLLVLFGISLGQKVGSAAPALLPGGDWFNSSATGLEGFRGKVVLINFWTHGCYNCNNSLPTLRDWYSQFKDKGFEIVGVHTPEFEYERVAQNVRQAIEREKITWPIVQDNESKTWRAYNNRYWPAFYLIDRDGVVRYVQSGEISSRFPGGIKTLKAQIEKLLQK
jgi:peroxiredoxin